jgi:hypothetical protein
MSKIRNFSVGKWRFGYTFGLYRFGFRRRAPRAGSLAFRVGVLTFFRVKQ